MPNNLHNALQIHDLEKQIGFPSGSGLERPVDSNQRGSIITWLVYKGVQDPHKNSNQTLSKAYAFPKYLNAILKKQREEKGNNKIQVDFESQTQSTVTELDEDDFDFDSEGNITVEQTRVDTSTGNFVLSKSIEKITRETIDRVLSHQFAQLNKIQVDNFETLAKDLTKSISQTTLETASRAIENSTKIQNEKTKILVEKIIFDSFLNHKISQTLDPTDPNNEPDEIPNISDIPSNSQFIPKLDPNYHFDPYATKVIRSALSMSENLYVYGDTGCGKTTHLEQVCGVLNRPLIRINPHDGITREMFLGGMKLINNETKFIEGALPIAMRNGYVFLVDEVSFLPPNLTAILNPVGEKGGKLYIPETSEWISPHPGFCIFATDNTGGKGDRTGNYTGTEVQNTATLDRFAFCLKMDYLPEEKEYEMLIARFPHHDTDEIQKMIHFAREIRSAFSRGELSITLSTRKLIKFFDQREHDFSIEETLSNTILSWLDEDDETLVKTMIDRLDLISSSESPFLTQPGFNLREFESLAHQNLKVNAIKELRTQATFLGLKEAKDLTESYMDGLITMDELIMRVHSIKNGA